MHDRAERNAVGAGLLDVACAKGRRQRHDGLVITGQVIELVGPMNRETAESLPTALAISVLDKPCETQAVDVRHEVGDLFGKQTCAQDQERSARRHLANHCIAETTVSNSPSVMSANSGKVRISRNSCSVCGRRG